MLFAWSRRGGRPGLPIPALLAVALLPAALVALPASSPVTGRGDGSSIQTISVPAMAVHAQVAGGDVAGDTVAAALPARDTEPFSALSATWKHGSLGSGVTLQVRTHAVGGAWGSWTDVDEFDGGPDGGSPDARAHARLGTDASDLVWAGASDGVQARVLAPGSVANAPQDLKLRLINPGDGSAPTPGGDYALTGKTTTVGTPQPAIRNRAAWGANESWAWKNAGCTGGPVVMKTATVAFVHHSATSTNYSAGEVPAILRSIYSNSIHNKGYCDFDYNFVVDKYGTIWEGRGGGIAKPISSGATGGFNASSVSVMLLGNYQSSPAPAVMISSLEKLLAWKLPLTKMNPKGTAVLTEKGTGTTSKYLDGVQVRFNVISGHRDSGYTTCPGENVYKQLGAVRDKVESLINASSVTTYDQAGYVPVTPARLLDTRVSSAIGKGGIRDLKVVGVAGVPATGISAVALNVTGVNGTANTFITVWPYGDPRPQSGSTVNVAKGQTQASMAVSAVDTNGKVRIYNDQGSVDVVIDILGYYPAVAPNGSTYHALAPRRVFDSRHDAAGRLGPGAKRTLSFSAYGAPASATAVMINVTSVDPTLTGYLSVYPGTGAPTRASSVNPIKGDVVANRVVVGLSGGKATVYNAAGRVDVVVDLVGWYGPASLSDGSVFVASSPYRILDTRRGIGGYTGKVRGGDSVALAVRGRGPVPTDATAVVITLTATDSSAPSFVIVSPGGEARPMAGSDLNNMRSRTVANLVVARIGSNGKINLYNDKGSTDLVADVVGYYVVADLTHPTSVPDSGGVAAAVGSGLSENGDAA